MTITVNVGGNPLVSGTTAYGVHLAGSTTMVGAQSDTPRIAWDRATAGTATLDGGTLAGMVSVLAPSQADGQGGMLAEAARSQPPARDPAAHDAYTRLLHRLEPDPETLYREAEPLVDKGGGVPVLDDSTLDKFHAKQIKPAHRH